MIARSVPPTRAILFPEDMIEDTQIQVHVLLEASLKEVRRNTHTWNTLYALGLLEFTSKPETVIWYIGNCIIAARTVREIRPRCI